MACEQSARYYESFDPFAPAVFAVSWAGEAISLNWFDTARELTERWHQQQIPSPTPGTPYSFIFYSTTAVICSKRVWCCNL